MFETTKKTNNTTRNIISKSNNPVLVSVIIPNYNQSQYVGSAITSVLNQTYHNYEIIVVDDGSTDNSRKVLSKFDNKIRYIWQENKGLAGARNTGIKVALGKYIGLLDADDEWQPTYLEKMVALSNQSSKAAIFYCMAQGIDANGKELPQVFGGATGSHNSLYTTLLRANFIIPSTVMMRRSLISDAGLFDENLRSCEDWDLWLRLSPYTEIVGYQEILVRYRIHGSSLSTDPSGMQNAARLVIEKHFGLDDGDYWNWSPEKRRAYGGVHRYHLITSIQRNADWEIGSINLKNALIVDPSLADDLDMFYELTLGTQPIGFRGTQHHLKLEDNISNLFQMLTKTFDISSKTDLQKLKRQTYGTANFAIGLLAYNLGIRKISRNRLFQAIKYRPELLREQRVLGNFLKSCLCESVITFLKNAQNSLTAIIPSKNS